MAQPGRGSGPGETVEEGKVGDRSRLEDDDVGVEPTPNTFPPLDLPRSNPQGGAWLHRMVFKVDHVGAAPTGAVNEHMKPHKLHWWAVEVFVWYAIGDGSPNVVGVRCVDRPGQVEFDNIVH